MATQICRVLLLAAASATLIIHYRIQGSWADGQKLDTCWLKQERAHLSLEEPQIEKKTFAQIVHMLPPCDLPPNACRDL